MRPLLTILFTALTVGAQDRFEVASIKPAAPRTSADVLIGDLRGGPGTGNPTQPFWRANTLGQLIRQAYGIKPVQLIAPDWVGAFSADRYDIATTVPPGTTKSELSVMLQDLLQDRFGLKFHRETREISGYTLTIAKSGHKLTAAAKPEAQPLVMMGPRPGGNQLVVRGGAMAEVVTMLEGGFRTEGATVDNQTGLDGKYDFEVHFADSNPGAVDVGLPALATALEQDLGLKLEKGRVRIEVLVVDEINKVPTEN